MDSTDSLQRAITSDETLRVITAITTHSAREASERQEVTGVEARVLARGLTAGLLAATLAKRERERVRIQVDGGGPIGKLLVDAHGDGRGRACTQHRLPNAHGLDGAAVARTRPSVAAAVGTLGTLTITRDLGLARPYQGSVALSSGEIDEDLEHYMTTSEQLPSALRCAAILGDDGQIVRAAGVLVQGFPDGDPEHIASVRQRLADATLHTLLGKPQSHASLAALAIGGSDLKVMLEQPLQYHCPCGPEAALRVLRALGALDLLQLADEQAITDVKCNFCGRTQHITDTQVRSLAETMQQEAN